MKQSLAPFLTVLLFASTASLAANAEDATDALHGQMLLRADEADYDTDNDVVSAVGHVEIDDQGNILLADRVDYDHKTDTVTASGHVSLMDDKGNVAFTDHVMLKDRMRDGTLDAFGVLIGKNGRLAGSGGRRVAGRYTIANHVTYTPCKICNKPGQRTPLWRVRAYRVVYDQEKHRFDFKNASLELLNIPFFYSPILSEPDPTIKYSSGLLTPSFGNSTIIGYYTSLPYYIAISDSNDATLAPLFSTKGGELLEGEYRQRFDNGGLWLQASFANNPKGGLSENQNQTYAHAFGSARYALDSNWNTGADLQYASNDTYLRRYDISQMDRLTDDLFINDEHGLSRMSLAGFFFEGLRPTDSADIFPYALPLFHYSLVPTNKIAGGMVRLDIDGAAIDRKLGPTSQRGTAEISWKAPFVALGGQVITLIADARGDVYHVHNNDSTDFFPSDIPGVGVPFGNKTITRGMPYFAVDWRWPFVNNMSQGRAIVIEPIAQLIAEPYGGNPSGIPNEDGAAFETDENDLFSFNRVPGYDVLESGPRINAGFRAEAIFQSGTIETEWGQTYRLKSDPIFAADTGDAGTVSDIVGRVTLKFPPYFDLTDRIDLDRVHGDVRRHEVYFTGTFGASAVQISYTQLPPEVVSLGLGPREEVNAQADINFYSFWHAFGAIRRDLIAGQMLDTEFGLGYEDDCLGVSVAYRRRFTAVQDIPPSTAVVLRFSLKTTDTSIQPFSLFPRDVFSHP
jgi:LPS-assembly protein